MFFSFGSITEEACRNSDFANLLYFKTVLANTQNYLSCEVCGVGAVSSAFHLGLAVVGAAWQHWGLWASHIWRQQNWQVIFPPVILICDFSE